jgi:hypothetical protein
MKEVCVMNSILLIGGAVLVAFWGIAHIFPTKGVVKDFGDISRDNRLIITMEWVVEGINLAFIGFLVVLLAIVAGADNPVSKLVYWSVGGLLVIMAVWHSLTGARTKAIPMKLCPVIFSTSAVLIFLGTLL